MRLSFGTAIAKATRPRGLQLIYLLKSNPVSTSRLEKHQPDQPLPTSKASRCKETSHTNNRSKTSSANCVNQKTRATFSIVTLHALLKMFMQPSDLPKRLIYSAKVITDCYWCHKLHYRFDYFKNSSANVVLIINKQASFFFKQ